MGGGVQIAHLACINRSDLGIENDLVNFTLCLTVEPGLYFGAWRPDVDCPERYANIGIRIEDDVLITAEGPVVLTADCPKTIDDIERIVGTDPQ